MNLWPVLLWLATIPPSCPPWLSPVLVPWSGWSENPAFQNVPLEMYLGTMKTITLVVSFDLFHIFEGDKGSSEGCVIWTPAFISLYTWKELISLIF